VLELLFPRLALSGIHSFPVQIHNDSSSSYYQNLDYGHPIISDNNRGGKAYSGIGNNINSLNVHNNKYNSNNLKSVNPIGNDDVDLWSNPDDSSSVLFNGVRSGVDNKDLTPSSEGAYDATGLSSNTYGQSYVLGYGHNGHHGHGWGHGSVVAPPKAYHYQIYPNVHKGHSHGGYLSHHGWNNGWNIPAHGWNSYGHGTYSHYRLFPFLACHHMDSAK